VAKIVTEKSQIPKGYQKKIKNFNKLTPNQAIYEYELLKLERRAGKEFGNFLKVYYQRPKIVRQKDIEEIRQFRGIRLKKAKRGIKPKKIEYNYPAMPDYYAERRWRQEYEEEQKESQPRSVDEQLAEIADDELYADYVWDLEGEAAQDQYDSPDAYLRDTNQTIDPDTGEVLDKEEYIAKQLDLVKEFFDDLRTEIDNSANQSIIVNSSYKNGRTRNTRSRQWITDNITRAKDKLITLIDSIEADEDRSISVYERFANDSSALSDLQDAISEYLAGSYSSPITSAGTDMNYQRVYAILSGSPMSLEDAEEFEI